MHGIETAACEVIQVEVTAQRREHDAISKACKSDIERDAEGGPGDQRDRHRRRLGRWIRERDRIFAKA
jgi:hypothetical protein